MGWELPGLGGSLGTSPADELMVSVAMVTGGK